MGLEMKRNTRVRAGARRDCAQLAISPPRRFHGWASLDRAAQPRRSLRADHNYEHNYGRDNGAQLRHAPTLLCALQAQLHR